MHNFIKEDIKKPRKGKKEAKIMSLKYIYFKCTNEGKMQRWGEEKIHELS